MLRRGNLRCSTCRKCRSREPGFTRYRTDRRPWFRDRSERIGYSRPHQATADPERIRRAATPYAFKKMILNARYFRTKRHGIGLPNVSQPLGKSARASDLRSAAIHKKFDARDETRVIRSEKQGSLGNFVGFPHASHRDGR